MFTVVPLPNSIYPHQFHSKNCCCVNFVHDEFVALTSHTANPTELSASHTLTDSLCVSSTNPYIPLDSTNLDGSVVYIGSGSDSVLALDSLDGSTLWDNPTEGFVDSTPVFDHPDQVVFCGSDDFNVYALHADTGAQKWKTSTGDIVYSSPTVDDQRRSVYIGSNSNGLYSMDTETGWIKW